MTTVKKMSKTCARKLRATLLGLGENDRQTFTEKLDYGQLQAFYHDWEIWARAEQLPPEGRWIVWLFMGGRGAGKTRAGAEWVRGMALGKPGFTTYPAGRIALVGETFHAARDVMVEGVSGLLKVHTDAERPVWKPSLRRLEWPSGAIGQLFSAEDPEALRGPQFHAAWADELGKWPNAQKTWDMLQFGLRLGTYPRVMITTTPRPIPLIKTLIAQETTALSHAATYANANNLSSSFLSGVVARYKGTRLGEQELNGRLIEGIADALWNTAMIEAHRVCRAPALKRIVTAVDPPASSSRKADSCGIIAAGIGVDGRGYILDDQTAQGLKPLEWARRAAETFRNWQADALIAEVNQGGEMVAQIFEQCAPDIPIRSVRASRGKFVRAEPVAALYAAGRISHAGVFTELEEELLNFTHEGLSNGKSPDRLDALVWALSDLFLRPSGEPRFRFIEP